MQVDQSLAVNSNRGFLRLKRKYESLGADIYNINKKGHAAISSSLDRNTFRGMFATLDKLYDKFNDKWDEAVEYADAHEITPVFPSAADEAYYEQIKSHYYNAQGYHIQVMAIVNRASSTPDANPSLNNSSNPGAQSSRAILPKIPIRHFHGDLSLWPPFKQLFTSLIKEESSLSNAERFHYLISFLEGPALDVIKHLPVVGENFEQAWALLLQVYDNKRKLACVYLDKFLNYRPPTGKPSADSLQAYLSQVTESVTSLQNLGIPDLAEYLLCELSLRNLDPSTRMAFETSIIGTTFPRFATLKEFVQNRCQVLRLSAESPNQSDSSRPPHKAVKSPNTYAPKTGPRPALMAHSSAKANTKSQHSTPKTCFICKANHTVRSCPTFQGATPSERLDLLRQFPGCRNCLHLQHKTKQCTSSFSCRDCGARHHSDLHLPNNSSQPSAQPNASGTSSNQPGFSGASTTAQNSGVLLGTVIAHILDASGNQQSIRCVLDPGSQFSFVTEKYAKKLDKTTRPFRGSIAGVNQSPLRNVKGKITLSLLPKHSSSPLETEAVVVPTVTPFLPQTALHSHIWDDYLTYELSDPTFTTPGPIDCLIGADLYPEVVTGAPIAIIDDGPRLLNTVFGYTVMGRFKGVDESDQAVALLAHEDLAPIMERFWEIEEPELSTVTSPEDDECEQHFLRTHRRMEDGRYMVSLPLRTENPTIIPNTKQALNRLYSLESKLAKSEKLHQDYSSFMKDYLELGHMSPASCPASYLIPHHPVYKVNGEDRKLRVVFDASFKTVTGNLNDHLHTGPKLQADVTEILLNFRRHKFVFSCDIIKMFRQILVDPNDRKFQQIAWRSDPSQPVQFYELNTVTYGLRSSPYLAQRVILQHALNYQHEFPAAAHVLLHNTYVDDIVGGGESSEDLINLKHQLIDLLDKGGFRLSKWSTNYPPLLEPEGTSFEHVNLCSGDTLTTKILGMKWDTSTDCFSYEFAPPPTGLTKRLILSTIARLFDPLGFIAPVVFYAKRIMQRTWQQKLGWDEEVSQEIGVLWSQFIDQLPQLASLSIPRSFPKTDTSYQLVCFSDASEQGFCGVVYLRATQGVNVSLTLVKAKTRLAPMKTLTIPRLELAGALLLALLIKTLSNLRQELNISEIYCFTDSMIALSWIKTMPHRLQTYVSNRVQQITALTKIEWWHHIRGPENPADAGSRGTLPSTLRDHTLWWTGPSWCYQPTDQWPISSELLPMELPELRPNHLALVAVIPNQDFIDYARRHSSFKRLIRVIAYIKRFISNARIPKRLKKFRTTGPVSSIEFRNANLHYIKLLQHHYYPEVFTGVAFNNLSLELRRLNIFLDPEGLARVGGRLSKAPLTPDHKNPILLPARSYFTNLIVDHFHQEGHHIGPTALLATIRQEYWIPKARNLVRTIRHKCVTCTRFSKSAVIPFMGDLPKSRFAAVRPFLVTGVDFAGPFLYKESSRRNAHHIKAYLCLFLCMSSRALHLEVATSLSVEGFLDVFDRFTSRRGLPAQVISDCGTNFQGAARYIQELYNMWQKSEVQASLIHHTAHLGVQWTFNPPSSPHFGGGWERSVRSVKDLLYKTFGNHPFTLPELVTIFTKIEGILNSRPILPQSSSPDDPETLTPGHFIIGQPITAMPELDLSDVPANHLNRWQLIRERIQYFWSRWKTEYLSNLQARQKWNKKSPNLRIGDLVLLLDLNLPPTRWPLGKIIDIHPGSDNIVRVVTVKTSHGIFKRPSVKAIPLVLEEIHA